MALHKCLFIIIIINYKFRAQWRIYMGGGGICPETNK